MSSSSVCFYLLLPMQVGFILYAVFLCPLPTSENWIQCEVYR